MLHLDDSIYLVLCKPQYRVYNTQNHTRGVLAASIRRKGSVEVI